MWECRFLVGATSSNIVSTNFKLYSYKLRVVHRKKIETFDPLKNETIIGPPTTSLNQLRQSSRVNNDFYCKETILYIPIIRYHR